MKKIKIAIIILVCLCLLAIPFKDRIKNSIFFLYGKLMNIGHRKNNTNCKNCDILFNDGINAHEKAYKHEGIKEQKTDEGLIQLGKKNILKSIESNEFYVVQDLTHSQPLLLPKAIDFINELSILYQQKCTEKNIDYVRYEITSVSRSIASLKRLEKVNENAIDNSPHLRGKTFDMSWREFGENKDQLKLFTSALYELKNQKKCFVKFERNGCLHITVN
ncbi:MAG: DUF5715 family protein [Sphingobacteriales bacterium]|nr:DUF5715 family protein [Sphingobacteriales bacterium]